MFILSMMWYDSTKHYVKVLEYVCFSSGNNNYKPTSSYFPSQKKKDEWKKEWTYNMYSARLGLCRLLANKDVHSRVERARA